MIVSHETYKKRFERTVISFFNTISVLTLGAAIIALTTGVSWQIVASYTAIYAIFSIFFGKMYTLGINSCIEELICALFWLALAEQHREELLQCLQHRDPGLPPIDQKTLTSFMSNNGIDMYTTKSIEKLRTALTKHVLPFLNTQLRDPPQT